MARTAPLVWAPDRAAWALFWLACGLTLLILQGRPTNADTSWGLTLGDAVLSGKTLYRDILETNPPMTVVLHLPAGLIARATGLSAELAQQLVTLAALLVSVVAATDILRATGRARDAAGLIAAAAVFQLAPWINTFGEREQFAVMAMLPYVALWRPPGETGPRPWRAVLYAGIGGGLATAIKPVFCLCLILPALHDMVASRRLAPLLRPEHWIAAGVTGLYLLAAFLAFPGFFTDFSRILADTYFQYRMPLKDLLAKPELGNLLLLAAVGWRQRNAPDTPAWATAATLCALGFALAFVAQAKGYLNHEMAVLSLGYMGVAGLIAPSALKAAADGRFGSLPLTVRLLGAPLLVFLTLWLYAQVAREVPYRSMALAAEAAQVPGAKTVLAISPDLDIGHPLARSAGLRYVGSTCSQWLSYTAMERKATAGASPALRARMDGYMAADLGRLAQDVRRARPDLIVLDRQSDFLARYGPAAAPVRAALQAYHPVARKNDVVLLARNDLARTPSPAR